MVQFMPPLLDGQHEPHARMQAAVHVECPEQRCSKRDSSPRAALLLWRAFRRITMLANEESNISVARFVFVMRERWQRMTCGTSHPEDGGKGFR